MPSSALELRTELGTRHPLVVKHLGDGDKRIRNSRPASYLWFKVILYCQETLSQKESESQVMVVVHAFNPSTQEVKAGKSLGV